jgi:hypothetical protein
VLIKCLIIFDCICGIYLIQYYCTVVNSNKKRDPSGLNGKTDLEESSKDLNAFDVTLL